MGKLYYLPGCEPRPSLMSQGTFSNLPEAKAPTLADIRRSVMRIMNRTKPLRPWTWRDSWRIPVRPEDGNA